MKLAGVSLLALLLATPAIADLTPGFVVGSGAPFPIVADFNGDGLDDLIQERNVILNHGGALSEVRALPFGDGERVVGVLDVNGDGVLDLLTEGSQVAVPSSLPQPPTHAPGYRLYIGDASRNYAKAIGISSGARPYVADVDADGKDDFVLMTVVRVNAHGVLAHRRPLRHVPSRRIERRVRGRHVDLGREPSASASVSGIADAIAATSVAVSARRRSARSGPEDVVLEARVHGDCIDESARWTFVRDGIFGLAKSGASTIEAVFDAPSIYFRLTAPYSRDPAIGVLTEDNGTYSGTTQMLMPCGYQTISVTANVE